MENLNLSFLYLNAEPKNRIICGQVIHRLDSMELSVGQKCILETEYFVLMNLKNKGYKLSNDDTENICKFVQKFVPAFIEQKESIVNRIDDFSKGLTFEIQGLFDVIKGIFTVNRIKKGLLRLEKGYYQEPINTNQNIKVITNVNDSIQSDFASDYEKNNISLEINDLDFKSILSGENKINKLNIHFVYGEDFSNGDTIKVSELLEDNKIKHCQLVFSDIVRPGGNGLFDLSQEGDISGKHYSDYKYYLEHISRIQSMYNEKCVYYAPLYGVILLETKGSFVSRIATAAPNCSLEERHLVDAQNEMLINKKVCDESELINYNFTKIDGRELLTKLKLGNINKLSALESNYIQTLICKLYYTFKAAVDNDVSIVIIGPIGCGAFNNYIPLVAYVMMRVMRNFPGIQYIYPAYGGIGNTKKKTGEKFYDEWKEEDNLTITKCSQFNELLHTLEKGSK